MKLLIVSPLYPPYSGVGSMRMNSLSRFLNKFHEITIIRNSPSSWNKNDLKSFPPEDIRIVDVDVVKSFKENASKYYDKISQLIEDENFSLILYSVGPYYTLDVAPRIKKKYNINYIIDFRDLWIYEQKTINSFFKRFKRQILLQYFKPIEKRAVKGAKAIITTTPLDQKIMESKYRLKGEKINTIYNGHEVSESILKRNKHSFSPESIKIVSLGKLGYYSNNLCKVLFDALEKISSKNCVITLVHIGGKEDAVLELIKQKNYENFKYVHTGYMEYSKAIEMVQLSDICVNIYNHPTTLGTKVFDYISCNKPILLVTEKGKYLSNFLSQYENARTCATEKEIIDFIHHIRMNQITKLDKNNDYMKYSRKTQNEIYKSFLERIL